MKAKKHPFSLFILIMTLLSACFGAVSVAMPAVSTTTLLPSNALGAGETFAGLQAAMRAAPGSFIMEKGQLILFAWPRAGEYAFAILGKDPALAAPDLNGLKVNTLSLTMMVKSLQDGGWKYMLPAQVPVWLANSLSMLTVEMAMTSLRTLPSVFLVPAFMFIETPEVNS